MNDLDSMRRAIELAELGRFSVSPNPMVGCVIVKDDRVIGEGFHRRAGLAHAEVEALRSCSEDPAGSTMYVSLEPCTHVGRTPPCVDEVIAARPERVVIAIEDPFPSVSGRGIAKLREASIEVTTGVAAGEATRQNERFLFNCRSDLPFVVLKGGMTLDGKLATSARRSKWITSDAAREQSLRLREEFDAILVGSGTIVADNPHLTRRLKLNDAVTPWRRVIVDSDGVIPPESHVLDGAEETLVYSSMKGRDLKNAESIVLGGDALVDLEKMLRDLFQRGVRSLIAEGGSLLHSQLIREQRWQKMVLYVAPMLIGGAAAPAIFAHEGVEELTDAFRLRFDACRMLGPDLEITAYPVERA